MPESAGTLVRPDEPFRTLNSLRAAHTKLLQELREHDDDALPPPFIEKVVEFLEHGQNTGVLLDVDEDRADAQTLLNYWTTVLYSTGAARKPALLVGFDPAASREIVGDISPYVGLRAFVQNEGPVFFGRKRLVQRITEWLNSHPFAALVGLSGSGKSSLARAGVMPALRDGAVAGSQDWRYLEPMVPGLDPVRSLAEVTCPAGTSLDEWQAIVGADDATFVRSLGTVPVVLVVDQLEELFTISKPKAACEAFVSQLVRLATIAEPRHRVIVTLRSDFEDSLQRYPSLAELFSGEAVVRVPPLDPAGLRNAIERPAARLGVSFEDGLVEELVQQVLGEPAGLPLLQFALLKLWERRKGKTITWDAYRNLGGNVREILASSASRTYDSFKLEEDRDIVEQVLKKLIAPGVGGEVTSKRLPRAELYPEDKARARVERVLDILVDAGLLRVTPGSSRNADQIEITHEALLRNWPLLTDWIAEDRERQRKRLQFAAAAEWWLSNGEHPSGLLTGLRLAEADEYENLKPEEQRFVRASHAAAESSRRNMWLLSAAVLLVALALLAWAAYKTVQVSQALSDLEQRTTERTIAVEAAQKAVNERNQIERRTAEARREFDKIVRQRDDIKGERDLLTTERDRLLEQRNEFLKEKTALAAEVAEVSGERDEVLASRENAKRELEDLQQQVTTIQAQLTRARQETAVAQQQASAAQEAVQQKEVALREAEKQLEQRPLVRLDAGRFTAPEGPWKLLENYASQIERNARSVGQVRLTDDSGRAFYITGFLVDRNTILTLWHPSFGSPRSPHDITVSFPAQSGDDKPVTVRVRDFIAHDPKMEIALFRIEPAPHVPSQTLELDFAPLKVASRVYIIGYPIGAGREQRVQPGYVVSVGTDGFFTHDCLTSGGNSGSPVIDLDTGRVVGIHWGAATARGPELKRAASVAAVKKSSLFPILARANAR